MICAYGVGLSMSAYGRQPGFLPASSIFPQPCWSPLIRTTVRDPRSGRLLRLSVCKSSHHQVLDMYCSKNPIDVTEFSMLDMLKEDAIPSVGRHEVVHGREPITKKEVGLAFTRNQLSYDVE